MPERPPSRRDLDEKLDEALEESFPGSDPPSHSSPSAGESEASEGGDDEASANDA